MKLTSPKEMECDLSSLSKVLELFEAQFKKEEKGKEYYFLVIEGVYSRNLCDKIQELYLDIGWENVICKTSSEKGERVGLTGLQLWRTVSKGN
jgi:hypothetical protein